MDCKLKCKFWMNRLVRHDYCLLLQSSHTIISFYFYTNKSTSVTLSYNFFIYTPCYCYCSCKGYECREIDVIRIVSEYKWISFPFVCDTNAVHVVVVKLCNLKIQFNACPRLCVSVCITLNHRPECIHIMVHACCVYKHLPVGLFVAVWHIRFGRVCYWFTYCVVHAARRLP